MTAKKTITAACLPFLCVVAFAGQTNIPKDGAVPQILQQYDELDMQCRGGSGDNQETLSACARRDRLNQDIKKAGWCWGPVDAPGYQQYWLRCTGTGSGSAPKQTATDDLTMAAKRIASAAMLSPDVKAIKAERDGNSYSLTITYGANIDVEVDTRKVATAFVQYLVSVGQDPSERLHKRSVHVCGIQDGLTTVTGKPGVRILGCSHYNPYQDSISWDSI